MKLLSRAKRIYDWIFDPARNINAAGSYGWFPESMQADGNKARVLSETCCTADMIELAMDAGSCDPKGKIEYTITWAGNAVISIEPQGKLLPLFP